MWPFKSHEGGRRRWGFSNGFPPPPGLEEVPRPKKHFEPSEDGTSFTLNLDVPPTEEDLAAMERHSNRARELPPETRAAIAARRREKMAEAWRKNQELAPAEALFFEERLKEVNAGSVGEKVTPPEPSVCGEVSRPPSSYVEVFLYWRIARDGTPTVSICDDPMSHPHAHLVRIPIPEDVLRCIAATKNPPLCLVVGKQGYATGPCPETTNETSAP